LKRCALFFIPGLKKTPPALLLAGGVLLTAVSTLGQQNAAPDF